MHKTGSARCAPRLGRYPPSRLIDLHPVRQKLTSRERYLSRDPDHISSLCWHASCSPFSRPLLFLILLTGREVPELFSKTGASVRANPGALVGSGTFCSLSPWERVGVRAWQGRLGKDLPGFSPLSKTSPQSILQRVRFCEEFLTECGLEPGSNVVVQFALSPSPQPFARGRGSQTLPISGTHIVSFARENHLRSDQAKRCGPPPNPANIYAP